MAWLPELMAHLFELVLRPDGRGGLALLHPRGAAIVLAAGLACAGCGAADTAAIPKADATYNRTTGRLEELKADTDGDGKNDAVAHMDGTRLKSIDVDRNGDGKPDRWEFYDAGTPDDPTVKSNP